MSPLLILKSNIEIFVRIKYKSLKFKKFFINDPNLRESNIFSPTFFYFRVSS